jgi:hypothetical protein
MENVLAFQKIQLVAKYVVIEEICAKLVIPDFITTMENVSVNQLLELSVINVQQIQISVQLVKKDFN